MAVVGVGGAGGTTSSGTGGAAGLSGAAGEASAGEGGPTGLGLADVDDDVAGTDDAAQLLNRWLVTMGPVLSAVQLASAVGHLARTTLGPYEIPVPRPGQKLLVVPANVARFAESWSLDPDEVRTIAGRLIDSWLAEQHRSGD